MNLPGRYRHQAEDGASQGGLAGAGFAHHAENLVAVDAQGNVVDRLDVALGLVGGGAEQADGVIPEPGAQVVHSHQGACLRIGSPMGLARGFGALGNGGDQLAGIVLPGVGEEFRSGAALHHFAGVHHQHLIRHLRHHGEIVGDEDHRHLALALQIADQFEYLRLDGDIESGGGLVADDQLRLGNERHGDHHPLAHAAGEFMGIAVVAPFGVLDAHLVEHGDSLFFCRGAVDAAMVEQRFDQLLADGEIGVQAGHRVLEDHRDLIAANSAHALRGTAQQVFAIEQRGAAFDPARRLRDQIEQAVAGHRFTGPGFADDAQGLARVHGKTYIVHRLDHPVAGVEPDFQIGDFE